MISLIINIIMSALMHPLMLAVSISSSSNFFNSIVFHWPGTNKVAQAVCGIHEGGVFSICTLKDGSIVTGGKDRRIVKWDSTYKKTGEEFEV